MRDQSNTLTYQICIVINGNLAGFVLSPKLVYSIISHSLHNPEPGASLLTHAGPCSGLNDPLSLKPIRVFADLRTFCLLFHAHSSERSRLWTNRKQFKPVCVLCSLVHKRLPSPVDERQSFARFCKEYLK